MENEPGGVWFELTAGGFRLRALCRSFTDTVMRVGLAAVVSSLPFVLWWDLILGVWSDEGVSFWVTSFFLVVWACAIAYADIIALTSLFGEVRITKENDQGKIFTGIGKLGWTHGFRWSDFNGLSIATSRSGSQRSSGVTRYIMLNAPSKGYKFGWLLPEDRQLFIIRMLGKHLFNVTKA